MTDEFISNVEAEIVKALLDAPDEEVFVLQQKIAENCENYTIAVVTIALINVMTMILPKNEKAHVMVKLISQFLQAYAIAYVESESSDAQLVKH